ncbi:MAG: 1-acyl-sn-glycerol-3-phosphate acyltransferase [bacterium]|nr:1-acyl-sn-glycerol-3-phosphate acyltransferase [bacterium]
MKNIFLFLYTCYVWMIIILTVTSHFVISSFYVLFKKNKESAYHRSASAFIRGGLFCSGIRYNITGIENVPENDSFIIVSNHQSHFDIGIYMALAPKPVYFIAKKELLKIPLLNWNLRKQGHITIDRKNAMYAVKQLETVKEYIMQGKSVIFFPEGTRSSKASMSKFKKGAFKVAVQTGKTIVPCYISGTHKLLNKNSWWINPGKVVVRIGKPVIVKKLSDKKTEKEHIEELMEETRQKILNLNP